MRKILIGFLLMFFVVPLVFAGVVETARERDLYSENVGWNVYASDDDMDTAGGLVTELDTTYAQLDAEDTLEVDFHCQKQVSFQMERKDNQQSSLLRFCRLLLWLLFLFFSFLHLFSY